MISSLTVEAFRTPRGNRALMGVRTGTSDHNTLVSCMTEDEYRLSDVDLGEGVALDIGAHLGGVAISLAVDNPLARVIAVEALSENVTLLKENVERNGVSDRITIHHAAASSPGVKSKLIEWNFGEGESAEHHRYIGNAMTIPRGSASSEKVPALSLGDLIGDGIEFCKIDCETCEYDFLDSPKVASIREIRGEFHAGFDRIEELLGDTHHVSLTSGTESFGAFTAVAR